MIGSPFVLGGNHAHVIAVGAGAFVIVCYVVVMKARKATPKRIAGPLVSDEEIEKAAREHEMVLDYGGPISNCTVET